MELVVLAALVGLAGLAGLEYSHEKKEEASLLLLAVRTGLEPATPCVTGMYSNQLNYRTNFVMSYFLLESECKGTAFF